MLSKNKIIVFIFIMLMFSFISCGSYAKKDKKNVAHTTAERQISDIAGVTLSIPSEVNKIVCRSGNGTSFLIAMGYSNKLSGTADYVVTNPWGEIFCPGITSLPSFKWAPSAEELYATKTDLVMLPDPDVAASRRKVGLNAICYKQYNEQEIIDSAKLMGVILDNESYPKKWITYYNDISQYIDKKLSSVDINSRPLVYYIYGHSNKGVGRTAGGGSIENYWIEASGGKFITADLPNDGPKITKEEVIARNPDVIFIGGIYAESLMNELMTNVIYQKMPAVSNKRIYRIPIGCIPWDQYGVEFPLLKLWVAKCLYPDLINKDLHKETKKFYKDFYNKNLSDNEINYILNGLTPTGTSFGK